MEEIQGHTTEEWYAIKPPDIFTSSLRHFHCLTAASQKKKKKKSLFVLDAGFSVATAASQGSAVGPPPCSSLPQLPTGTGPHPLLWIVLFRHLLGPELRLLGWSREHSPHFTFCFTLVQSF